MKVLPFKTRSSPSSSIQSKSTPRICAGDPIRSRHQINSRTKNTPEAPLNEGFKQDLKMIWAKGFTRGIPARSNPLRADL